MLSCVHSVQNLLKAALSQDSTSHRFYAASVIHTPMGNSKVLHSPFTQENATDPHTFAGGLRITNNGRSALPGANHGQGQLRTPQSVTIEVLLAAELIS